jgi:8-oxo-dGTP pyrophosphatase MutT (NUDIX family)
MMVSSDPKFGGPMPMISKGKIEDGESAIEGAVREAEEELGLRRDNIKSGTLFELAFERVVLHSGTYDLTVYGCEINDRYDFDKWCDETEYTVWLTADEFKAVGRRDHLKYVQMLEDDINKRSIK